MKGLLDEVLRFEYSMMYKFSLEQPLGVIFSDYFVGADSLSNDCPGNTAEDHDDL